MSTESSGSAGMQPAGQPAESGTLPGAAVVLPLVPGVIRRPAERRPLPDAAALAVRMFAIPDSAPPYDDELGASGRQRQPRAPALPGDGAPAEARPGDWPRPAVLAQPDRRVPPARPAALDWPAVDRGAPPGQPVPADRRAPDRPAPGRPVLGPEPLPDQPSPGRPVASRSQPAAAGWPARTAAVPGWPGRFAQVLAETLAGARPPRQIAPWTTERARRHIQRLGPLLAAGEQPRVRRVVTSRPARDVVEMTVVVGIGPRVRAVAVRLERAGPRPASPGRDAQAARWVCTAVEAA
jgi:hypothetical protein